MNSLSEAKATQMHIDVVLSRPMLPIPFTYEDNSELTWMLWDEATIVLDFQVFT